MGDGEQVKGQVAEARRIAVKEKLASLTAIVDWNDIQISGRLEEVMPVDIPALWAADGWKVIECCGHDYAELYKALKEAAASDIPTVVLCHNDDGARASPSWRTSPTTTESQPRATSSKRRSKSSAATWRSSSRCSKLAKVCCRRAAA